MENRGRGDPDIQRLALALHLASQDELWLGRISSSRVNEHAESLRDFFHHHPAQPNHANPPSRPGRLEDFYRGYNESTNNPTQRRPSQGATCRPPLTDNHTGTPVAATCQAAPLIPSTLPATIHRARAIIHASPRFSNLTITPAMQRAQELLSRTPALHMDRQEMVTAYALQRQNDQRTRPLFTRAFENGQTNTETDVQTNEREDGEIFESDEESLPSVD